MCSPLGTFVGFSAAELADLKADMLVRLKIGVYTSTSGSGKSGTKQYPAQSMEEVQTYLREINYALGKLNGTNPPRRVTQVLQ